MRLLVSVRNAAEASAALAGGADIIDAKEPLNGPLGPPSTQALNAIAAAVGHAAPLSVALGDIDKDVASRAAVARHTGVTFVKLGFARMRARDLVADVTALAIPPAALVLVAYADFGRADSPLPDDVITLAGRVHARGILLDTYDKRGVGLTTMMSPRALASFVSQARRSVGFVALAGRLAADDIDPILETGADVIGFRGAACEGGRSGDVTSARVRALRDQLRGLRHVG